MKKTILTLTLLILSFCLKSQENNFTYFNTYRISEFKNKENGYWIKTDIEDTTSNHKVWYVFFEKEKDIILFQDSSSHDYHAYKITGQQLRKSEYQYKTINTNKEDVYIYFYREEGYSVIRIDSPNVSMRYRIKIDD